MRSLTLLLVVLLGSVGFAEAQAPATDEVGRPYLRNVGPREYEAHAQNWAFAQTPDGLLYVGNGNGVLEYDGVSWRHLALTNEWVARSLATDEAGTVYVGGVQELGRLEPDSLGALTYASLVDEIPEDERDFQEVWATFALPDGIYFYTDARLFRWADGAMTSWTPEPDRFFFLAYTVRDTLFVLQSGVGLMAMRGGALELVPGGEAFADKQVYAMLPYGDDAQLVVLSDRLLILRPDGTTEPFETEAEDYLLTNYVYHATQLPDSTYALGTLRGGVALVDPQGRFLRVIDEEAGLRDETVNHVFVDQQGGLWLGLDNGLARVEVTPRLSVFNEESGLRGFVQHLTRHDGVLYAATMLGVYRLEPGGADEPARFVPVEGIPGETWALLSYEGTLLAASNSGVYQVIDGRAEPVADKVGAYTLHPVESEPGYVVAGLKGGVLPLRLEDGRWVPRAPVEGIAGEVRYIEEDAASGLWLGLLPEGLLRLRYPDGFEAAATIDTVGTESGLPAGRALLFKDGPRLLVSSAETGLFRYDPSADPPFRPDTTYGQRFAEPEEGAGVFRFAPDHEGNVWIATSEGVGVAYRAAGAYQWDDTPLKRAPHSEVYAIYPDHDGGDVVWFGRVDGVVRLDQRSPRPSSEGFQAFVRRMAYGDSLLFGGVAAGLPVQRLGYTTEALRFEYAAPAFDAPVRTRYQVRLDGFDDTWSSWTDETKKDYTNLPEGDYTFRVRARDVYGHVSQEGRYAFTVLPPWYRTWWAYLIYAVVALGLVGGAVRAWTWRLREQNRRLEAIVRRRTAEIRRKNEENERLLLNILPGPIADRLKQGEDTIADAFAEVTVVFADLVGFTTLSQNTTAARLVDLLNELFSAFDRLALEHGVEKIKTIGDAYMAVAGLPEPREDHAEASARLSLAMLKELEAFNARNGTKLRLRIGLNSGPVVAGVIGQHKFIYDLWGDAVNTASRMESHGVPNRVHVSEATYQRLAARYTFEARGTIEVKGKGHMETFLMVDRQTDAKEPAEAEVVA